MLQVNYQFFPHLGHFIHIPFRSMFLFRFPALSEAKQKSSISIDWTTKIQKHEYKDEFSRPTFTALAPSLSPSVVCLLIVLAFIHCLWGSGSPRMRIKLHGKWKKNLKIDVKAIHGRIIQFRSSSCPPDRIWRVGGCGWWGWLDGLWFAWIFSEPGPDLRVMQGKVFTTFPWLLLQCHALSCQPTI